MAFFCRNNLILCPLLNISCCKFTTCITRLKSQNKQTQGWINNNSPPGKKNRNKSSNVEETSIQSKGSHVFFQKMIDDRRIQANSSVLVQVQSISTQDNLQNYLLQFGNVLSMHHYKLRHENFILVEFDTPKIVKDIMSSAMFMENNPVAPVKTSTLWYRDSKAPLIKQQKNNVYSTAEGLGVPTETEVLKELLKTETISMQMTSLYNLLKLTDLEIRLRFYTACQIEQCFSGLFSDVIVHPFGSSVNGFGKRGCDLDLAFVLQHKKKEKKKSNFIFHTKKLRMEDRAEKKELLVTLAKTMDNFIPGIFNVQKILEARVPIIKFNNQYTNQECDLTIGNHAAIHMSELLCIYGELDTRIRPLVFTIRKWAQVHKLTSIVPGRWITNFSLSLLVLFYLQQKKMLPSLNTLRSLATHEDVYITDTSVDCTFLRDIEKIPQQYRSSDSNETMGSLLHGFFDFYAKFDFKTFAISIQAGIPLRKPDHAPLFIHNPFEYTLNVSKNVSTQELQRLIISARDAVFLLENIQNRKSQGLLSLFGVKANQNNNTALIDIKTLFVEGRPSSKNEILTTDDERNHESPVATTIEQH